MEAEDSVARQNTTFDNVLNGAVLGMFTDQFVCLCTTFGSSSFIV